MALTKEERAFVDEADSLLRASQEAILEARQLSLKLASLIKRFEKAEKVIRDMAKEHNIS